MGVLDRINAQRTTHENKEKSAIMAMNEVAVVWERLGKANGAFHVLS